jgi:glutamate formiminotransferase
VIGAVSQREANEAVRRRFGIPVVLYEEAASTSEGNLFAKPASPGDGGDR